MATRRGLRAIALAGWKQCAIASASRSSTPFFARGIVSVARARGDVDWNRPIADQRSTSKGRQWSFASSAARPRDFSSSAVVEGDKKSKDDDEEKKKKKTRREKDLLLREGVNENIFAALLGVRPFAILSRSTFSIMIHSSLPSSFCRPGCGAPALPAPPARPPPPAR
jgi:hypothetical protein